jgi:hypothetical protein
VIKYLRRALDRRARRIQPGGLIFPASWDAWKLDDDQADALRHAVAKINRRVAADIEEAARRAQPLRKSDGGQP